MSPYQKIMEKVLGDVQKYGVSIMHVFGDDGGLPFTYTIGCSIHGAPEAMIRGLSPEHAHAILSNYYHQVLEENLRVSGGELVENLVRGLPVGVRELTDQAARETYLVQAYNYAEMVGWLDDFKSVQLVWPDEKGIMPWEPEFNERFRAPNDPADWNQN